MPRVCLIGNVGQRDLQRGGKPLDKGRIRDEAQALLECFEQVRKELSAPMIEEALRCAARDAGVGRVESLVLVATDQVDERFRSGDTEPAARAIKALLEDDARAAVRPTVCKVHTIRDAPNDYDAMLREYRNGVLTRCQPRDADRLYVLCAGGTPACNTALLIAAIERYGERVTALYVNEATRIATPLRVSDELLRGYRRVSRDEALAHYDFSAVAHTDAHPEFVRNIARAALARANFDFNAHDTLLGRLHSELTRLDRRAAETLLTDARALANGKPEYLLREVYWSAWVRWAREEYADFLGRMWRIIEMAYQLPFAEITGFDLDGSDKTEKKLREWVERYPALLAQLEHEKVRINQSRYALEKILEAVQGGATNCDDATRDRIGRILTCTRRITRLAELRNKSVIAHGFKGLSREIILTNLEVQSDDEMWEAVKALLAEVSVTPGANPFDRFRTLIQLADPTGT